MDAKKNTIFFFGLFFCFLLAGCGMDAAESATSGIYVDATFETFLRQEFEETKACSAFTGGEFQELAIIIMPTSFPCEYYKNGCSGEFHSPNTIKIGVVKAWQHEVIHYLLYVNTGDSDARHTSFLFNECVG